MRPVLTLPSVAFGHSGEAHARQVGCDLVQHWLGDAWEEGLKVVLRGAGWALGIMVLGSRVVHAPSGQAPGGLGGRHAAASQGGKREEAPARMLRCAEGGTLGVAAASGIAKWSRRGRRREQPPTWSRRMSRTKSPTVTWRPRDPGLGVNSCQEGTSARQSRKQAGRQAEGQVVHAHWPASAAAWPGMLRRCSRASTRAHSQLPRGRLVMAAEPHPLRGLRIRAQQQRTAAAAAAAAAAAYLGVSHVPPAPLPQRARVAHVP